MHMSIAPNPDTLAVLKAVQHPCHCIRGDLIGQLMIP